jgi:large conductance mechanosensitive channel
MLKGFRDFILRGNVIDLAVAVVIGAAFALVVKSIIDGLITPLIAAIFGKPDLTHVGVFTLNGAEFSIGLVLTALINFLLIAAAIYFLVVVPVNKVQERLRARLGTPAATPPVPEDVVLLREIRDALRARPL